MKIFRVTLNKDVIENMPEKDKVLLFGIAHFTNEVKFLFRSIQWSSDYTSSNNAVLSAQISLSFFYTKLLAGKLHEGWKMINKTFGRNKEINKLFDERGSEEGKQALSQLKKLFGRGTSIVSIRNEYAFHFNPHKFNLATTELPDELAIFLEKETNINTLYSFAEVIANKSMLNCIDNSDLSKSMDKFYDEINIATGYFVKFCEALIEEIFRKYSPEIWKDKAVEIQFEELKEFTTSKIHWFADTNGLSEQKQTTAD